MKANKLAGGIISVETSVCPLAGDEGKIGYGRDRPANSALGRDRRGCPLPHEPGRIRAALFGREGDRTCRRAGYTRRGKHQAAYARLSRLLLVLEDCARQSGQYQAFGADGTYRLHIPGRKKPTTLDPDASLVALAKLPPLDNLLAWDSIPDTAPDLACEVASKGQTSAKMATKAGYFLAAGTRLVWVIYPRERRAEMLCPGESEPLRLGYADSLSGLDVAPGLTVRLRELC